MFGLTTMVSLVNNPHLDARGHLITDTVDNVVNAHMKPFNIFQQYQIHGHNNNHNIPFGNIEEDEQYQNIILAKIRGEEAKAVLGELDKGFGIYFSAYLDENNEIVVELHREVGQLLKTPSSSPGSTIES